MKNSHIVVVGFVIVLGCSLAGCAQQTGKPVATLSPEQDRARRKMEDEKIAKELLKRGVKPGDPLPGVVPGKGLGAAR